jgi:hypothetical protein
MKNISNSDSPVVPDIYDVRIRSRNLTRGIVTKDELKKHLTSLPDDTENAIFVDFNTIVKDEETPTDGAVRDGGFTH